MTKEYMFKLPKLLIELQIVNIELDTKTTERKARTVFRIIYFLLFYSFFSSFTLHLIYSLTSISSLATYNDCEHFNLSFLQNSKRKYVVGKNGTIKAKGQRVRLLMTKQLPQNIEINVIYFRRQLLSLFKMLPINVYFFTHDFMRTSKAGMDSQVLLLTNSCGFFCLLEFDCLAYYLEDLGGSLKESLATQPMMIMERRQRVPMRMFSRGVFDFITDNNEY